MSMHSWENDDTEINWPESFRSLLKSSTSRIVMGGLTAGALAFGLSYHANSNKNHKLAFSEIEKTTRLFGYKEKPVPPLTRYYAVTNDLAMKVFEAKNLARGWGNRSDAFAYELEKKLDPAMKIHAQIPEYAQELAADADAAKKSLTKMIAAKYSAAPVVAQLDNVWDESHTDEYRTEVSYETVCDSDGKNCRTEMRTQQVYDHTDHVYVYHSKAGDLAARKLAAFKASHPDIDPQERLVLANSTEAENEQAIRNSMTEEFDGKYPTQQQYNDMANKWATGSNFSVFTPAALHNHAAFLASSARWNAAKQTAHSVSYETERHSDPGPVEYQVTHNAIEYGQNMSDAVERITHGINMTATNAPELAKTAQEFVDASLHYKDGDADALGEKVIDLAKEIYGSNFEKGLDQRPFKWENIALWTLFGMAAGAGAAAGGNHIIDVAEDKKRRRDQTARHGF